MVGQRETAETLRLAQREKERERDGQTDRQRNGVSFIIYPPSPTFSL